MGQEQAWPKYWKNEHAPGMLRVHGSASFVGKQSRGKCWFRQNSESLRMVFVLISGIYKADVYPSCPVWLPLIAKQKKSVLVWRILRKMWALPLMLLTVHRAWAELRGRCLWWNPTHGAIKSHTNLRRSWALSCFSQWEEDKGHKKTVNEQFTKNKKVLLRS